MNVRVVHSLIRLWSAIHHNIEVRRLLFFLQPFPYLANEFKIGTILGRTQVENGWDMPAANHERMPWSQRSAIEYGECVTVARQPCFAVAAEWTVRLTHYVPLHFAF